MGTISSRKYHQNQAKSVVNSIGRIIKRVNPEHTPDWLLKELDEAYRVSQHILAERTRDIQDHGEEIYQVA